MTRIVNLLCAILSGVLAFVAAYHEDWPRAAFWIGAACFNLLVSDMEDAK